MTVTGKVTKANEDGQGKRSGLGELLGDSSSACNACVSEEAWALGPSGEKLTRGNLPDPATIRWTVRRKAEVIAAVEGGLIDLEEGLHMYGLNQDEYYAWREGLDQWGPRGLRITRLQTYKRRL